MDNESAFILTHLYITFLWLLVKLIYGVLECNICLSDMLQCPGLCSEIEETISIEVAILNKTKENDLVL